MPYATITDIEDLLGYSLDDTGSNRPSKARARRILRKIDQIINNEIHEDNNILNERTKITCSAKSELSGSEYFYFYISDDKGGEAEHYIWYDVTDGDSDPSKNGTNHEVDISSVTTAREVAVETATIIDAIDNVTSWSKGEYLYIQNDNRFNVTDAVDGDTSFTFSVLQDGRDDHGGLNAIACDLAQIWVNNIFATSNPDAYAHKEIKLSDDHIRTLHKTYGYYSGETIELDGR